jgi:hypothetical protein
VDYINAHRKAIIAAIAAIVVIFVPDATPDMIAAIVGAILTAVVPNDQAAVERVYGKHGHGK